MPRVHGQKRTLTVDSGINDRLVKLRSLIIQTCFEFIDVMQLLRSGKLSLAEHRSRCCILLVLNKPYFGLLCANYSVSR